MKIEAIKQIVWLASYPKSGNTWVRLFLEAYLTGNADINRMLVTLGDDAAGLYNLGDGGLPHNDPIEIILYTRPVALLRLIRIKLQDKNNQLPLILKTHVPCINANGIEMLPVQMTRAIVHIVRDPRDVVSSYANHMGLTIDEAIHDMQKKTKFTVSSAQRVGGLIGSWDLHARSFLETNVYNRLKTWHYEDLRLNPGKYFAEILEHIGFDVDRDRIDKALELTDLDLLARQEKANGFVEASHKAVDPFFHTGDVMGWKKKLTDIQALKIYNAFSREMKKLGYTRSGYTELENDSAIKERSEQKSDRRKYQGNDAFRLSKRSGSGREHAAGK